MYTIYTIYIHGKHDTSNKFGVNADIRNVHLIWKNEMIEKFGGVEKSQRNVKHEQLVVYIYIFFRTMTIQMIDDLATINVFVFQHLQYVCVSVRIACSMATW